MSSTKRVLKCKLKKKIVGEYDIGSSELEDYDDQVVVPSASCSSEEATLDKQSVARDLYNDEQNLTLGELDKESDEELIRSFSEFTSESSDSYESSYSEEFEIENYAGTGDGSFQNNQDEVTIEDVDPEINEIRVWAVESRIAKKHVTSLIKIKKKRLLPKIPSSSKTLLYTSSARYFIETMQDTQNSEAEFCYLSISEGLKSCVNPLLHANKTIQLDFNIDGVKIKKSSPKTMWPILCKVYCHENPQVYKPFTVAVFHGNVKPKDVVQYFGKFLYEINSLLQDGIVKDSTLFKIEIRCFICDTPARSFIKCTKGHTSFNGCERCEIVAKKVDNTTVYIGVGNPRTDNSFRNFTDVNHHISPSPLIAIEPKIDLVNQFVLDSMHLLYLGIMLRLFEKWMKSDTQMRLSAQQKSELDRRTKLLKDDIPKEFHRKMRSSSEFNDYKAVEHRFFLLYCGPIVLKKLLDCNLYNHFLLLHVACRMLSCELTAYFVNTSRFYLHKFVEDSIILYGPTFSSLNVHNLIHLSDDVQNMRCNLNNISAFPYENELGKIKQILLSPNRTVAQYCRRIHEERSILDLKAKVPEEFSIIKMHTKKGISQMMYKNYFFSTSHPDDAAILINNDVVQIERIFLKENVPYLHVKKSRVKKSLFSSPCDSAQLNILELDNRNIQSEIVKEVPLNYIASKLVKIFMNFAPEEEKRCFVMPILH